MKRQNKVRERKVRSLISGKILKNYEALSINDIKTYLEKQGIVQEDIEKIICLKN
jgi:predicted nucleotide-binding protein (sugar kinase/HSP70/actin superfamily)